MLRGLDPTKFSVEDNALLYLGLSSYITPTRGKQDEEGNMFLHIREAKEMAAPQTERPARDSNARLAFHTDQFPDILALYCLGRAKTGGNHNIASSYAIYNELSITRPDVLETLASPDWYFDSRSLFVHPERRPLLFHHQGHIILNFGRIHLMATEPTDDGTFAPKPTAKQLEALDLVQQLAKKHHLSLNMDPGDLTFINNLGILHAREEFTDSPEHTRHLVRMWLKHEDKAWPLPRTLKRGNDRTYDMSAEEIWNILPAPRVAFKIRDKHGWLSFLYPGVPTSPRVWWLREDGQKFAQARMQHDGMKKSKKIGKNLLKCVFRKWHFYIAFLLAGTNDASFQLTTWGAGQMVVWVKSTGRYSLEMIKILATGPSTSHSCGHYCDFVRHVSSTALAYLFKLEVHTSYIVYPIWVPFYFTGTVLLFCHSTLLVWNIPLGFHFAAYFLLSTGSSSRHNFPLVQFLWRRNIKACLHRRAIEEEENEEALNERLRPDALDDKSTELHIADKSTVHGRIKEIN
ncbi:Clavaminate synthase-like protein [Fusarium bulbicola]|nr:Clavaminate synthase-like protein [Fusarium bulbicola]